MTKPIAKEQDRVTATDTHIVLVPGPGGPVPTPTPLPFAGPLDGALSPDVYAEHKQVAVEGSTATNTPAHVAPSGSFQSPPSNRATVHATSATVFANGKPIARNDDPADTCNDPVDAPVGRVIANATVFAGG